MDELETLFITSGCDVQKRFSHAMIEEVEAAQVRASIRIAQEFPHLLSESQASILRSFYGKSGE